MVTRLLILLVLLAATAQGQVVRKVLRPDLGSLSEVGLTARWAMEEKLAANQIPDKTGNGWIAYNATGVALLPGTMGGAASLTGGVYLTAASLPPATNHSIVAWLYNKNTFPNGQAAVIFAQRQVGYNRSQLYISTSNQLTYFDWKSDGSTRVNNITGSSAFVPQNRWTMVAVTTDNATGTAILYVNGTQAAATSYTGVMSQTAIDGTIGWETSAGNPDRMFRGMMDEVRYYSRALTAADVRSLYYFRRPPQ